jgi:hypothetical protein
VKLYFHAPNKPPWRGAQLKHRDMDGEPRNVHKILVGNPFSEEIFISVRIIISGLFQ